MNNNTANKSTIISSKTVFQSKFFKVDHLLIERNGKKFEKDIIEQSPTVLIVPYTENNEIYVESQYRDVLEKTCLEVVAGHIDEGEDPLSAAKRELREETGLTAENLRMVAVWNVLVTMRAKIHVFFATDLKEGKQQIEDDEVIKLIKMPIEQALKKIELGEFLGASHIAAILLFDKMRREGKL